MQSWFLISILGVITVTAVGAGEATITVKCGTAEDVVIEATVEEAAPVAPEGGKLFEQDQYAVARFYETNFVNLAGKTVTVSFSICKRGGSDVGAHLQFGDSANTPLAGNDSWNKPITDDWTVYSYDFAVPESWGSAEYIYLGMNKVRDNETNELVYAYEDCTFYYKDFSVVEKSEDENVNVKTITAGSCDWWDIYGNDIDKSNTPANDDGSVTSPLTGQYKEFKFQLPTAAVNLADYTKIVVDFESDSPVAVKVWSSESQRKNDTYGNPASLIVAYGKTGTIEFDLTSNSVFDATYTADAEFDYTTFDISHIAFMMGEDGPTANVTFNSVTFK